MSVRSILKFEPIYKGTVWGGRRLEVLLSRELPGDGPVGESWELVDLPEDQSPLIGAASGAATLGDLREREGADLMGGAPLLEGRFPLLFKFIDANRTLSVQVHPDEEACARLGKGARPKTEAWYIIEARPGAALFVGLKPGVDREAFGAALEKGTVEDLLHRLPVEKGDFVFLPAGTIHAIGEGIVLAEVQQSSATTYRVFDWNRVGLDGKPRQLHIEEALEATDFERVGKPDAPSPASGRPGVSCPFFEMELVEGGGVKLHGAGPLVLMGVSGDGAATVRASGLAEELTLGRTLLVPASISDGVTVEGASGLSILATRVPAGVR